MGEREERRGSIHEIRIQSDLELKQQLAVLSRRVHRQNLRSRARMILLIPRTDCLNKKGVRKIL